jgi:hypothetical protein
MLDDAGLGVDAVGRNAGLRSGEGHGLAAEGVDGHGGEGDGGLLARGEEHVHLTLGGLTFGRDFFGELDEVVRHAGHGGDDGDDLIARALRFQNAACAVADALWVADGGAAIFLDDEGHAGELGKRAAESGTQGRGCKWGNGEAVKRSRSGQGVVKLAVLTTLTLS